MKYIVTAALLFLLMACTITKTTSLRIPAGARTTELGNEILYYVIVDRFFDANPDNNIPDWAFPLSESEDFKQSHPGHYAYSKRNRYWLPKMSAPANSYEKGKIQQYWGGDLEGVIAKLPYLADLGVTAVMISPVFDNVNGVFYKNGETSYHGYWTKDWFRLDEHFANPPMAGETVNEALSGEKLVKRLTTTAHKLGLKIFLDMTFNQTSPAILGQIITTDTKPGPINNPDYHLEFSPVYRDGVLVNRYCNPTSTKTCGDTLDTSGWYNPTNYITDYNDRFQLENHQMHSLPDINQHDPYVQEYLLEATKKWLSLGVDGLRVDAIKHLFKDFTYEYEKEILKVKPDIVLIGEFFDGGMNDDWSVEWLARADRYTMFDFTLAHAIRDFFRGKTDWIGTPEYLEKILTKLPSQDARGDRYDPGNSLGVLSDNLITFINNHDLPRMLGMGVPGIFGITATTQVPIDAYHAALKFLMVSRGVPKLTYGDEIALSLPYDPKYQTMTGIGGDPWSRPMMDWNKAKTSDKTFVITKRLINLRKKHPELRHGYTRFLKAQGILSWARKTAGSPYLAMERWIPNAEDESKSARVYFFYSSAAQNMSFRVDLPDGTYTDAIENNGIKRTVSDGLLSLDNMNANEVVILASKTKK
jgi:glycosidase